MKKLITTLSFLSLVFSCDNQEDTKQNIISISKETVEINGNSYPVLNSELRTKNYNVLLYQDQFHVFSLKENFIGIDSVNQGYSLKENGSMYFIIETKEPIYPIIIKFTSSF